MMFVWTRCFSFWYSFSEIFWVFSGCDLCPFQLSCGYQSCIGCLFCFVLFFALFLFLLRTTPSTVHVFIQEQFKIKGEAFMHNDVIKRTRRLNGWVFEFDSVMFVTICILGWWRWSHQYVSQIQASTIDPNQETLFNAVDKIHT